MDVCGPARNGSRAVRQGLCRPDSPLAGGPQPVHATLRLIVGLLAFLGRHGARAFAVSIFLGLALPGLAASARPLLPVTILLFVTMNVFRADFDAVRRVMADRRRLWLALGWSFVCQPLVAGVSIALVSRFEPEPGLILALALYGAAPPLVAAPAYAMLLGLPSAFALTVLVMAMSLSPLTAPLVAGALAGSAVPIDPAALGLRLAWMLGGATLLGLLIRRLASRERIRQASAPLDGFGILMFFVFAIAVMDGVADALWAQPLRVLGYTALAFAVGGAGFALTLGVLRAFDPRETFALAMTTGLRNMGILVAVMPEVPPATFLFFAVMQVPIYCAPQLLRPLASLLATPPGGAVARAEGR